MSIFMAVFLAIQLLLISSISTTTEGRQMPDRVLASSSSSSSTSASCPLNFTALETLLRGAKIPKDRDGGNRCHYIQQGIRLVLSEYLRVTDNFLPPVNSSESCWSSYQKVIDKFIPNFNILSTCGFETSWISQGCMNITTKSMFESVVPKSAISDLVQNCNQSLLNNAPCASCTISCSSIQASYLNGSSVGNVSDCAAYPLIYAGGIANFFGPTDPGTVKCLFDLELNHGSSVRKKEEIAGIAVAIVVFIALVSLCIWGFFYWRRREEKKVKKRKLGRATAGFGSSLLSLGGSTHLMKFTYDDIKEATRNFSRDYIIGRGGYGNVYKGVLPDGTEVAVKRFKNCSAFGEAGFSHEVEVIASVRHVNLVALRGYCVASTPLEGHQRILVCDLMRKGSLDDHLFGSAGQDKRLSWPQRQKIALGTAHGLAYLHYGAQPTIIHRDVKANNILLDDSLEAKIADFGLARFTPEGVTHVSTKVAGTKGYLAPEYVLLGQLTERSDVYSFGVVLLELLSGKKAIMSMEEGKPVLISDWAWALVKQGRGIDVIEPEMPDMGPRDIMEKYVMLAVLCSHPTLYARPTMDQVVKVLEAEAPMPLIPERPISIIASLDDITRSASTSGSGHLSASTGNQPCRFESQSSSDKEYQENTNITRSPGGLSVMAEDMRPM